MKRIISFISAMLLAGSTLLNSQTTVKDADGNIYLAIKIGSQIWIAENLKTTKFNDGKAITLVESEKSWSALMKPGFCYFNNNPANKDVYGVLYNWFAVNTRKLCPKGWHVPTDKEWSTMIAFLGDRKTAANKLKEPGNDHWKNYLATPTNDFDFTALPGGTRLYSGSFPEFGGDYAVWWTSSEYSSLAAYNWGLHESTTNVFNGYDNKQCGFSVRCIMDQK